MGAYENAGMLLPGRVLEIGRAYGYSEENLLILSGQELALRETYPQTYRNILSCGHQRDNRSPFAYAQDLVASWVVEDYFLALLQEAGCQISAAGADRKREILSNAKVSAASDFQIKQGDKLLRVEFMCDYTGYWSRSHRIDLRDSKFEKLRREQSIFLGVDARRRRAILLDFRQEIPGVQYIPSHRPYGGKPAYSIPCENDQFFPLLPQMLAKRLLVES